MKQISPSLIVAGLATAALLSSALAEEPTGLAALFPDGLLSPEGEKLSLDALKDKPVIGIYFSAHWCGPCRKFTPNLVKYRNAQSADMEIVFVSSDRSEKKQFEYMKEAGMTWPTVKFQSDAADALKEKYEIRGIPALILVDADGKTITREGRGMVMQDVPADKIAKARIVKEEYKCGNCDKTHTRDKLVFEDDEAQSS